MSSPDKRLFLIDGSALMYRAHFAFLNRPLKTSRGEITSAIFGFLNTLISLIEKEQPTHLAVVFDTAEPTFRHKTYKEYKATRQKMPDELVDQLGRLDQVLESTGLPVLRKPGFEADDVIGTLAREAEEKGYQVYMVTGDKDYQQLVTDDVKMYNPKPEGTLILGPKEVEENFGVPPERVIDVLSLMGDSSDNVPGVEGIGPKTAVKLVNEHGSLDKVLKAADKMKSGKLRDSLIQQADQARLSRELVTIDRHVPIEFSVHAFDLKPLLTPELERLLTELELFSLLKRLSGKEASTSTPTESSDNRAYHSITKIEKLEAFVETWIRDRKLLSFDVETTGVDPMRAELVGASFSVKGGSAIYVSMEHVEGNPKKPHKFERFGKPVDSKTSAFLSVVRPLLEDEEIPKTGQNVKYDSQIYLCYGIEVKGIVFDTILAAYLLNPGSRNLNIDALSAQYLHLSKIPTADLIGAGKNQKSMRDVDLEKITEYACEDADYALRLTHALEKELGGQKKILDQIEVPLIPVLLHMEHAGIKLDTDLLADMSKELDRDLKRTEKECYHLAGEEFNLNSPKQLAVILFEKLKLPVQSKTKSGPSTDVDTLTALAPKHELASRLLDYRMLSKLKSTYVDSLPELIHPFTGRVHTTFSQTVAATGRLASVNPNLQNIPIRTETGRRIREAFIPGEKGWKLVSADYGQVELRIMAHLSGDKNLIAAFEKDGDIHRETAARMFMIEPADVTPDMRRAAKTVNFGIIYGQTDFGLSQELGIPRAEAKEFRANYFKLYPGVADFMRTTIEKCRETGYVETMLGRRRSIPDITASNRQVREFGERIAINTPVQGSAADMIKLAMIAVHDRLKQEKFAARMLLQVHDELVFESPESEVEKLSKMVRHEMATALKLRVPVIVDVNSGNNWLVAH